MFSLVRYKANDGVILGHCSFEVQLLQNIDARREAERVLGPDIPRGQITWLQVTTSPFFPVLGENRAM